MSSRMNTRRAHALNLAPKEISMAKCTYCGEETQLHSNAVPICLVCAVQMEPRRKPPRLEHLHSGKARPSYDFASSTDASLTCPECNKLEAGRFAAIQRYVNLKAARECVLKECPSVAGAHDAALIAVEKILNEAWGKLADHHNSHLAASA